MSEPQDIGEFATEIFNDVYAELKSRSGPALARLPGPDRDAALTAIQKAAWRGILRGIALVTFAVNQQADEAEAKDPDAEVFRIDSQMQTDPEPDFWAERYGQES